MVGKKVLYKSPNDIPLKLSTLCAVNGRFLFQQITQRAIAQTLVVLVYILLHIYANLWLKILKFGGPKKNEQFFDISKIAT